MTSKPAATNRPAMTRPACLFPAAKWNGKGSANDAANFTCEKPGA